MISMDVFFKQMKKWVYPDDSRPVFRAIYCDGEKAVATDTHQLVIVKNWKAPAGFLDIEGRPKDLGTTEYPKFDGVTPPMEKWDWRLIFGESLLKRLKDFCAYAEKLNRGKGRQSDTTYLGIHKAGEQVMLYCMNDKLHIRVGFQAMAKEACDKESETTQYIDAMRLRTALEFLLATGAQDAVIGGKGGLTILESPELYMTICGVSFGNAKGNQSDLPDIMKKDIEALALLGEQEAAEAMLDA